MKDKIIKFLYRISALVFIVSALFFCCGFTTRLPKGVRVNGVDVGGLTRGAAKLVLRQDTIAFLKQKHLHICASERTYSYVYPEIDFKDKFGDVLATITKKGEYSSPVYYYLNGADEIASAICQSGRRDRVEPYVHFNLSGDPFTYYEGSDGVEFDKIKLLDDISKSLNGAFDDVYTRSYALKRRTTVEDLRRCTQKLYSFTTYFDAENTDRSSNIRLAGQKINGTILQPNEVFSFNKIVGARTEEGGFKPAKIIENGKFVYGTGGGVCQVSTTLYNAALLSGLSIEEYHPHSLQVSYVAPSRDAMVSGNYFDLKFKNNRKTPIYVRVITNLNSICCTIFGESDGYTYSVKSSVIATVPRPDTVIVEGDEDKIINYGRDGTVSEGYLVKVKGGQESVELIRKDKYLAVADVVQKKSSEAP